MLKGLFFDELRSHYPHARQIALRTDRDTSTPPHPMVGVALRGDA